MCVYIYIYDPKGPSTQPSRLLKYKFYLLQEECIVRLLGALKGALRGLYLPNPKP